MANLIRKIYLALALLSITSISYAYGESNLSFEEDQNFLSCQSCCRCDQVFVSAEVLGWRAFQGGLDRCVPQEFSDLVIDNNRVISNFNGRGKEPDFCWNPGFRIGLGYESSFNAWDLAAIWTHFRSNTHDHHCENRVRWKINLDVLDVVAGYEFDLGSCFTLRPYGGLRGARIYQHLHVHGFPGTVSNDQFFFNEKNKERFLGLGPLFGIEGNLDVSCGFSVFANASVSWLYGNFHVRFNEYDQTPDTVNFCQIKKHLDAVQAVTDVAVGVRWQTCLCANIRLLFQLSLEHHRYFDHNRIGCYGDLYFDGVAFGAGLEF